ncbi:response regulator [Candidatus Amoebophilus asiaticus]|nr:response regulator [Candidatus Amoebophilus asiaticus]
MSKYTILIVDDESSNLQILISILTGADEDYSILSALNGQDAIDIAKEMQPNLILMDWKMPGLTGIETLKELKSDQKTAEIPVFMTTSVSSPETIQEFFEAGAFDIVNKPIIPVILLTRIRSALGTKVSSKDKPPTNESAKLKSLPEKPGNSFETKIDTSQQSDAKSFDKRTKKLFNLDNLRAISGDDDQNLLEYIEMYLEDIPEEIEKLKKYQEEKNWEALEIAAHNIKTRSDYLGAVRIRTLAENIEEYDNNVGHEQLTKYINEIEDNFSKLQTELVYEKEKIQQSRT